MRLEKFEKVWTMNKFKTATRKSQKLAYALIGEYANNLASKSEYALPTEYFLHLAKIDLKTLYKKATKELRTGKAFDNFNSNIAGTLTEALAKDWTIETKVNVIKDDIDYNLRLFIEDLANELGTVETFSLALKLCGQEKMNKFITFLFDYYLDNEIGISETTKNMIVEQDHDKYIYACLKSKVCAICGVRNNIEFEHYDNVARIGGYKFDTGEKLRYWSLCDEHHKEKHTMTISQHYNKYKIKGIYLSPEQIPIIKKIYPNHMKAYKQ